MKINQLKVGAILSYISMAIGYIIALVYTPIMLRLLGQSEFGIYSLSSSIVSYLWVLSFGFGSAYVKFYYENKVKNLENNIAKLNFMFLVIFSVIGLLALTAGMIITKNINIIFAQTLSINEIIKVEKLMKILVLGISISFPLSVFNSYISANEQYLFQRIILIVKNILNPIFVLPLLFLGYGSVALVFISVIINLTSDFISVYYCIVKLKMKFKFELFSIVEFRRIGIFSFYIFLNMLVDQINWNVDKFLVGIFNGSVAVAVYGVGSQLNSYYRSFSLVISTVFIPRINRIVAQNESDIALTELFARIGRLQFIIQSFICSALVLFGKSFIRIWAGANYENSYYIMIILILSVTIPSIQNIGIEIQRAKNMHQYRSVLYVCMAIVNIIISIPLCKLYGGIGSAIGTATTLFIGNVLIMNFYYHNKVGLDMKYFWKQIIKLVPPLLPTLVIGVLIGIYIEINSFTDLFTIGFTYFIVFAFFMWIIGMNRYEKSLLINPFIKMKNAMKSKLSRKNIR